MQRSQRKALFIAFQQFPALHNVGEYEFCNIMNYATLLAKRTILLPNTPGKFTEN